MQSAHEVNQWWFISDASTSKCSGVIDALLATNGPGSLRNQFLKNSFSHFSYSSGHLHIKTWASPGKMYAPLFFYHECSQTDAANFLLFQLLLPCCQILFSPLDSVLFPDLHGLCRLSNTSSSCNINTSDFSAAYISNEYSSPALQHFLATPVQILKLLTGEELQGDLTFLFSFICKLEADLIFRLSFTIGKTELKN